MQIIETLDSEVIARLNKDIHDLHVSLYPSHFKKYHFDSINEFFKNAMTNPKFVFYLIEDLGQHLGYAWIEFKEYQDNAFMNSYRSIFVHQIGIRNEYRNNGFGSQLMNRIYTLAKEKNIQKIELDYWIDNDMAMKFYKKNGFKGYRKFVYKDME